MVLLLQSLTPERVPFTQVTEIAAIVDIAIIASESTMVFVSLMGLLHAEEGGKTGS